MNSKPDLKVFVYGTLKSGFINHEFYCQGVSHIEKACLYGELYDMGVGYPALKINEKSILAHGTLDHLEDVILLEELKKKTDISLDIIPPESHWHKVFGEVLTFKYPGEQLKGLDECEEFNPLGKSLYQRVLTWVQTETKIELVWLYVIQDLKNKTPILDGVWK